jgi:mono/diheme cytochrome c family protein
VGGGNKEGAEHFQHHCQICHGLDGQLQEYADGQLKWIIENGIRFSGMPGWKGILSDQGMWHIVRYLRHLPQKGSVGVPSIYEAHEHGHH